MQANNQGISVQAKYCASSAIRLTDLSWPFVWRMSRESKNCLYLFYRVAVTKEGERQTAAFLKWQKVSNNFPLGRGQLKKREMDVSRVWLSYRLNNHVSEYYGVFHHLIKGPSGVHCGFLSCLCTGLTFFRKQNVWGGPQPSLYSRPALTSLCEILQSLEATLTQRNSSFKSGARSEFCSRDKFRSSRTMTNSSKRLIEVSFQVSVLLTRL